MEANVERAEYFRCVAELRYKNKEECKYVEKYLEENGLEEVMKNPFGCSSVDFHRAMKIVIEALNRVNLEYEMYANWRNGGYSHGFNYTF